MRFNIILQVQLLPAQRLLIPLPRFWGCSCQSSREGMGLAQTIHPSFPSTGIMPKSKQGRVCMNGCWDSWGGTLSSCKGNRRSCWRLSFPPLIFLDGEGAGRSLESVQMGNDRDEPLLDSSFHLLLWDALPANKPENMGSGI